MSNEQDNKIEEQPTNPSPSDNNQYVTTEALKQALGGFASEIKDMLSNQDSNKQPSNNQDTSPVLQEIAKEKQDSQNLANIKAEMEGHLKTKDRLFTLGNELGGDYVDISNKYQEKYASDKYSIEQANNEMLSDFVTHFASSDSTKNSILGIYKDKFDKFLQIPSCDKPSSASSMLEPLLGSFDKYKTEQIARGSSSGVSLGSNKPLKLTDYYVMRKKDKNKK